MRFGRKREGGKVEAPENSQCLYLLGWKNNFAM